MRVVLLLGIVALAGCGSTPQSLGITGPGATPAAVQVPGDSTLPPPGMPNSGGNYRYNIGPAQSDDRYFNYN